MVRKRHKKAQKEPREYELKAPRIRTDKRLLALDPGSRNMGISAVGLKGRAVHVLANSVMTRPINDLKAVNEVALAFMSEVDRWITLYKPDGIIAERFQTRGLGGPLIEQVSVMLGLLIARAQQLGIPIKLVTASQWKNKYQRRYNVEFKTEVYPEIKVQPHQLDASLIGCYGLELGTQQELQFDLFKLIGQVEDSSCVPHIKGRN